MRFGERFSYCDPQIPASAGVRPCVCFSVSWVDFSGRLLPVVLGSLWNWRMAGLRSLCLRVVGMVLPSADQAGVGWSPASVEDTAWVLLVECGRYLLRGPPEGAFPSRFLSVGRSVGREAPIAGTVGRCRWDCRSKRLRWFGSAAPRGCSQQWGVPMGGRGELGVSTASGLARRRRSSVTWLILPVVICLSQRLSHACASINA